MDIKTLFKKPKHTQKWYEKRGLKQGIKIELEHTDDPKIAEIIAKHHIDEYEDYYPALIQMEKDLEFDKKNKDLWIVEHKCDGKKTLYILKEKSDNTAKNKIRSFFFDFGKCEIKYRKITGREYSVLKSLNVNKIF